MEEVEVKVYEIVVHSEEFGIIVFKPFAVKNFDLRQFLTSQPIPCFCFGFYGIKTEKVPAWTVPKDIEFVE